MAPSRSKASSLLSLLLLATPIVAKYSNDFSYYPSAAQPCLYSASDSSQCDGDNVTDMNKCLCSDSKGKFVTNAAKCLGKDAKSTASEVYNDLKTSCTNSNTALSMSQDDFNKLVDAGASATSLSVTPTATSRTARPTTLVTTTTGGATITMTSTPTPTQSNANEATSGLSTTAKIGIGVGGGVAAVAIVGVIAFIWRLKKSRAAHEESRPMLDGGIGATGYNPHHSPPTNAAAFGVYNPQEYKTENKTPGWRPTTEITPSPSPGAQTWATNSPQPPYAPYAPPPQQQQQLHAWGHHPQASYPPPAPAPQPGVFELASIPVQASSLQPPPPPPGVVEMPATEVQPPNPRFHYPKPR